MRRYNREGHPMARVLLANELGMGDLHLRRLCALAQALRAHGHEPVLAVHDLPKAHTLLADGTLRRVQAPVWRHAVAGLPPVHTYTDLMLRHGFVNLPSLLSLARAWRDLVTLLQPALVVADHAPVALFATRELGLPRLRFGDGIGCPPLATPMPPMTWWDERAEAFDDIGERNVLHVANQAAAELGLAPAASVAELLQADGDALCTLPELDVYPARSGGAWCGPLVAASEGQPVPWPDGDGPCAYVALGARHPLLQPLLAALQQAGQRAVLQVADAAPEQARQLTAPGIVVARTPVPLSQLRRHCSHAVLDGRPTTAQGLLLLGKPVLMLPTQLEGQMLSRRVQALGAGLWLDAEGDALPATADLVRALQRLADDGVLADTASAWARQHASHSDERTLAAVLARCDTLLSAR